MTIHREPHQRAADQLRGLAQMLEHEWKLALTTARHAPHRPRPTDTGTDRGGVRSVGTHSDPTSAAAIGAITNAEHHPLAHREQQLKTALHDTINAANHLAHLIEHTLNFDQRTLERLDREQAEAELRAAKPQHRYCFACETPIDTGTACEADKKLRQRTNPADYVTVAADQSPAALDAAFVRWVQARIAQGTLVRPGSPHARIGERVIVHEHEVA